MKLNNLTAISPVDGRYRNKTEKLSEYFSEFALIKYRLFVEIEYFISLCELPVNQLKEFDHKGFDVLRKVYQNFNTQEAQKIKEIEKTTNHDVKAVEYYLKNIFKEKGWDQYLEFIHFGLTSQDVNNTAIPMTVKEALNNIYLPLIKDRLAQKLNKMSTDWKDVAMLAKTHGQAASPTRLGKEIAVFSERIENQIKLLENLPISGKFGGATGNFNAHYCAYPSVNWNAFANQFLKEKLGIERQQTTTQIEHYDMLTAMFDNIKRINTILIDFCQDIWLYVSMDYFKQKVIQGETGSSAMPHKVNPIDFENAEGNFGIANAAFEYLSRKLPISRLQRDLTDSTVCRNIGVPFAHTIISVHSILKGLDKLLLNKEKINADLENNWAVVAEGIQTILRREQYPEPYEALKKLTRQSSGTINREIIHQFIDELDVSNEVKEELKKIEPGNYTGNVVPRALTW